MSAGSIGNKADQVCSKQAHRPREKFTISEDRIFKSIDALIASLSFSHYMGKEIETKQKEILRRELTALNKRKHEVKQEYQKIKARQERILDLYLDEIISKEELREKRFHLDIEAAELKKQKRKLNSIGPRKIQKRLDLLMDALWEIPRYYKASLPKNEKADILRKLISKIIVTSQKIVKIKFKSHHLTLMNPQDRELLDKGIAT